MRSVVLMKITQENLEGKEGTGIITVTAQTVRLKINLGKKYTLIYSFRDKGK